MVANGDVRMVRMRVLSRPVTSFVAQSTPPKLQMGVVHKSPLSYGHFRPSSDPCHPLVWGGHLNCRGGRDFIKIIMKSFGMISGSSAYDRHTTL